MNAAPLSMDTGSSPTTLPLGPRLTLARLAWVLVAVASLSLLFVSIPSRYEQLRTVSPGADRVIGQLVPADAEALEQLGLSPGFYAAYFTSLEVLAGLPFLVVGVIVFLRRPNDWVALLASLSGISLGSLGVTAVNFSVEADPLLSLLSVALRGLSMILLVTVFLVFPDGRFVPRRMGWVLALFVVFYLLGAIFLPEFDPPRGFTSASYQDIPALLWMIGILGAAVYAQIYRYRNVSTPLQRQQSKWPVYGLSLAFSLLILAVLPNAFFASLREPGVTSMLVRFITISLVLAVGFPAVPVTTAFAILRYRLWDIDVLINRTLVYGSLTAILALVYFGGVALLQNLLRGITGQGSTLAVVAATLAIAALFSPLRRRIQDGIDRRFYRARYDAERILAAFGEAMRDEVDLDELSAELVTTVGETMQPEHISLLLTEASGQG